MNLLILRDPEDAAKRRDIKSKLALDIDDTIVGITHSVIKLAEIKFGIKGDSRYFNEKGITNSQYLECYRELWFEHTDELKPLIEEKRLIQLIEIAGSIDFVTARDSSFSKPLESWFRSNFPNIIERSKVIILDRLSLDMHGYAKLMLGHKIIIDDSPSFLKDYALKRLKDSNQRLILIKRWNDISYSSISSNDNVFLVNDINEAIDKAEELLKGIMH
ncbi:MAG: hypothetical protein ARM1_0385 [Candidatus Micrarchaeota archaeon]|nr:MAG: hypothetical protein ARM1_0385 [Candidatus Micrarchaeota archaeon]